MFEDILFRLRTCGKTVWKQKTAMLVSAIAGLCFGTAGAQTVRETGFSEKPNSAVRQAVQPMKTARLFYSIPATEGIGVKAGGAVSGPLKNGEVYCSFEKGTEVRIWLENATDSCTWKADPSDKVEFFNPTGKLSDTVRVRFKTPANELTEITISVTEKNENPVLLSVIIPRRAAPAGSIIVAGLLDDDTTYCEDLKYSVQVAPDPNYTATVDNYAKEGLYPDARLWYSWWLAEQANGNVPTSSQGSLTDPEKMYEWNDAVVSSQAKYWIVQPYTCDQTRPATNLTSREIINIIPKKLTTDKLSVRAIRRIEGEIDDGMGGTTMGAVWDTRGENPDYQNACIWYSAEFNRDNAVEQSLGLGENENGYVYLQAMPYKPDDISYRHYEYEWTFDTNDLEFAEDKMATYAADGFGRNKGRVAFKVKDRENPDSKAIEVSYRMICTKCNEKAKEQGLDIKYLSDPSSAITLTRIDSLTDAKIDYTPYVSKDGEKQVGIDGNLPSLCGNMEYDLCNDIDEESGVTGFLWKGWNGDPDWEEAGGGDYPGVLPLAIQPMCNSYKSPSIEQTDTKQGDTLRLLTYPQNACFHNGNDTSRNAKILTVYVRSVPRAPILIDTIAKMQYRSVELEEGGGAMGGGGLAWPEDGVSPLLLCNNSFGTQVPASLGNSKQAFLVYSPQNSLKPENFKWDILTANEITGVQITEDVIAALQNVQFESYKGREWGDTNVLTFELRFDDRNLLRGQTQIPFVLYAEDECGAGEKGYFAINIIDTLAVEGRVQAMNYEDPDYDVIDACEGEKISVENRSIASTTFITDPADKARNTDVVEYRWQIPSTWRFDKADGDKSTPGTTVWFGQEKGAVRLALRNRCGTGRYHSGDSVVVNPYTRVAVMVVDEPQDVVSKALNPQDPADRAELAAKPFLLRPCQGSFMMYAADTSEKTDRYRWEFPADWEVITDGTGYNGTAENHETNRNWAYTENGWLNSAFHDMRVRVKVGGDTGQVYVVGSKDACAWTFDNYAPNLLVDPPHYGHRRDSLKAMVRPFTSTPVQAFAWPGKICARKPVTLAVMADPKQDSLTRANTYFSWRFTSQWSEDGEPVIFGTSNAGGTGFKPGYDPVAANSIFDTLTFTMYPKEGDLQKGVKDTLIIYSHRADCETYNEGDSLIFIFTITDTLSLAEPGRTAMMYDAFYPGSPLNHTPCEGDTVYYAMRGTHPGLDSVWWTWNGSNLLTDKDGNTMPEGGQPAGSADEYTYIGSTGWKVLNTPGHYADTLKLVVGRSVLQIGVQAASLCGLSAPLADSIRPVCLVRDTAHWEHFRLLLCEGEKAVFEHDSIAHATAYQWYYPWGKKTDTVEGYNKVYRTFSGKTEFGTGRLYVRPFNVCGFGPFSDTVKIATLIGHLGIPSVFSPDLPDRDYEVVADSMVADTLCLRTEREFEASFASGEYPGAEWKYGWFPLSVGEGLLRDSIGFLPTQNPDASGETDSSRVVVYKRSGLLGRIGLAVRHKECLSFGDTLVLRMVPADTIALPANRQLSDYLYDLHAGSRIQLRPCGNDSVRWQFRTDSIDYCHSSSPIDAWRFVWYQDGDPRGRVWNSTDSIMAGMNAADGFKWLNGNAAESNANYEAKMEGGVMLHPLMQQDQGGYRYRNGDTLYMRVGNDRLLNVAVDIRNRCGVSRLAPVNIKTTVKLTEGHRIGLRILDNELFCDRERLTIKMDSSDAIGGYIWEYPWGSTDTVTYATRSFEEIYAAGTISVTPYNGCGNGPATDTNITIIRRIPSRAIPFNFDPAYDGKGTAVDSVCMNTETRLRVAFTDWKEDLEYETMWRKTAGDNLGYTFYTHENPASDSCLVAPKELAKGGFVFETASRVKGCERYSDTLKIRIFPMDTLSFTEIVEDPDAGITSPPFTLYLPGLVENMGDGNAIDRNPCGGTGQQYTIRPQAEMHWSAVVDSMPYFAWGKVNGERQYRPAPGYSLAGTDWLYAGDTLEPGKRYTSLSLRVGYEDTLQLYVQVRNLCGLSHSPALQLVPKPAVRGDLDLKTNDPLCLGGTIELGVNDPVHAKEYYWEIPATWSFSGKPGQNMDTTRIPYADVVVGADPGQVVVQAANDCGVGATDTLEIMASDIISMPGRPDPIWRGGSFSVNAYDWIPGIPDTVLEWVCLNGDNALKVRRKPEDGSALEFRWERLSGDKLDIKSGWNDSVCIITAVPGADGSPAAIGDSATFMVWATYPACGGSSDPLFIRLKLTDTVEVSLLGDIVDGAGGTSFEMSPCPGSELTFAVANDVAPGYRWTLPDSWLFTGDSTAPSVTVRVGTEDGPVTVAPRTDPDCLGCTYTTSDPLATGVFQPRKAPVTPPFTDRNNERPCVGSVETYRIDVSGADPDIKAYRWEVPGNWKILASGLTVDTLWEAGLAECQVEVGTDSGFVRVYALDSCNDLPLIDPAGRELEVVTVDTAKLEVLGDMHVCLDSTLVLTVNALNPYTNPQLYSLEVEYSEDGDQKPIEIVFPQSLTNPYRADSTFLEIKCVNRDTVRLIFTPLNLSCPQSTVPFVHCIIADTIPEIPGVITGPEYVCADNGYTYTFHLDKDRNAGLEDIGYTWEVPHAGWRILSGLHDTIASFYLDSLPSDPVTGHPLQQTDTIRCYPRGLCGTAMPTLFVVRLQPQDPFADSILTDNGRPCLGTDLQVWLRDADRYDTDTIRFLWEAPADWVRSDTDSLPHTSYRVQYGEDPYVSVRYHRDGGCGFSQTLRLYVAVKDSATKVVLDGGTLYPCYTRQQYVFTAAPDTNIDRIEWFPETGVIYQVYTRDGSAIENDSIVMDNAVQSMVPTAIRARSWNECGSRDTVLTIRPITGTTPFTDFVHVPRFCVSDTGYAWIRIPEGQKQDGTVYAWILSDSAYRPAGALTAGDTAAVFRYVSDSLPRETLLTLRAANDCAALPDEEVRIEPFTYSLTTEADPVRVPYGTEGVRVEVVSTGAGPMQNFTYVWGPENRLSESGPDSVYRLTGMLVQPEETFYVEARQKMLQDTAGLAFYRRDGLCFAYDTVKVYIDSLFAFAPGSYDTVCVDAEHLLRVTPFGGNGNHYYTTWWQQDGRNWEELPGFADSLEALVSLGSAGDYVFRVAGRDSTFLYAGTDASDSLVLAASHADTVYLYVSVYDLDVRFGNVVSDRIEVPIGSRLDLETQIYDGTGHYACRWLPEDLILRLDSTDGSVRTIALFRAEELRLTVTDTVSGCVRDRTVFIGMGKEEDIPNSFTPNGDGKNDVFLRNVAKLTIYTRWGNELFHTESGEGWDGTYKGKTVKPGEYLYVAEIGDGNGKVRVVKGVISVIL